MRPSQTLTLLAAGLSLVVLAAGAGPAQARPDLDKIGMFDQPVYLTAPKGDRNRVFVVEKSGRIRVAVKGRTLDKPFLNLSGKVSSSSEQGLLSMAFSPRYDRDRTFYVNFTDRAGDTRVVAFRAQKSNPNVAAAASARPVLRIDQPASNHNGGQLQFGPDGLLYIGMGDGGGAGDQDNNAQDRKSLLGKMLRIDPTPSGKKPYRVPSDNPFVGNPAWRPEIYSSGLRNPWRFSFDRSNGDLIIADVGQDQWEEIDHSPRGRAAGANFGWRVFEGPDPARRRSRPRRHGGGWGRTGSSPPRPGQGRNLRPARLPDRPRRRPQPRVHRRDVRPDTRRGQGTHTGQAVLEPVGKGVVQL